MLHIVETLSDPGRPDKPNEDAFGHTGSHAWVIDGATDVADGPLIGAETGAHWLAHNASALFAQQAAAFDTDLQGLVRRTIETLAERFEHERLRVPNGRYELPSAAMALLYAGDGKLACANFADCGLVLVDDVSGEARIFGAAHLSREARAMSRTAQLIAGLAPGEDPFASGAVIDYLRASRNLQNIETGYWILGLDPAAADHLRHWELPLARPMTGLLFSDGFGSIVFDYHRMDAATLVRRCEREGLAALLTELRHIEYVEDPAGHIYPRFKPSDDATAMLFRAGE
jgi:hypothetical protein